MRETERSIAKPKSSFDSLSPESISSDKANINYLILEEFNRINYLLTIGLSSINENRTRAHIARGIYFGLRSIESMMAHVLDEKYYELAKPLKEKLTKPTHIRFEGEAPSKEETKKILLEVPSAWQYLYDTAPDHALNCCAEWYDLLVRQLPAIQLTATPKKPYDFK